MPPQSRNRPCWHSVPFGLWNFVVKNWLKTQAMLKGQTCKVAPTTAPWNCLGAAMRVLFLFTYSSGVWKIDRHLSKKSRHEWVRFTSLSWDQHAPMGLALASRSPRLVARPMFEGAPQVHLVHGETVKNHFFWKGTCWLLHLRLGFTSWYVVDNLRGSSLTDKNWLLYSHSCEVFCKFTNICLSEI